MRQPKNNRSEMSDAKYTAQCDFDALVVDMDEQRCRRDDGDWKLMRENMLLGSRSSLVEAL